MWWTARESGIYYKSENHPESNITAIWKKQEHLGVGSETFIRRPRKAKKHYQHMVMNGIKIRNPVGFLPGMKRLEAVIMSCLFPKGFTQIAVSPMLGAGGLAPISHAFAVLLCRTIAQTHCLPCRRKAVHLGKDVSQKSTGSLENHLFSIEISLSFAHWQAK